MNSKIELKLEQLKKDTIIEGPFWREHVRVISSKTVGGLRVKLEVVGVNSERYYHQILSEEDLKKLKVAKESKIDFSGDPEAFFLATEGWRIRYAYQFDPFCAVTVSKIDPVPHQIEAVYHYVLKNPRIRFLLADDAGAGKTIMAGLILKELKYRGLIEKILIIVPGHLKPQWQRDLKEKFNETFTSIGRAVMEASWGRNVWQECSQAITSIDFAKQEDVMVSLAEVKWDLVIVDEAHRMSAYQYKEKTSKTERYKLGEHISRNTNFLLFLTATPHRGDPENFRLFLNLLEPGFFASTKMLSESIKDKDNPLFLRRLKEDMKDFYGAPIFPPRQVKTVKYHLSDDEVHLYNGVTEYVQRHYRKAELLAANRKRNIQFAMVILQRRLASSVRAIRKSLERRKHRLQDLLEQGKIIQELGYLDEEILEDLPELDRWKKEDEFLEKLTSAKTREELKEEIDKLDELIKLAKEAEKKEIETKLNKLKEVTEIEGLRKSKEKLLIFTESKDTMEYLVEKIRSWGYSVTYIHGGMNLYKRIQAENEFSNRAQVMVATEAAGEGINLQFCWLMVNYDIPWNPNRLEQRMGRIHRYGQQNEVHIHNLVAIDTTEGKILNKLFEKLAKIREHLGDRVFDVIGEVLPQKSLKELILDAIAQKRSLDDILADFDRVPDEEAIEKTREATMESLATRHIDLSKILGESRQAKENRLIPEYVEQFFLKASYKLGLKVEKRKDGFLRIHQVPFELRDISYNFKNKYGEVFREYTKFSFIKEEAFKAQAEFVAMGHPLLEAVIERVFGKYNEHLRKGATFIDPSGNMEGPIWFLEAEIQDGNGRVAGKRIFAIYKDKNGIFRQVSPSVLWDLKPQERPLPLDFLNRIGSEEEVINFAVDSVLSVYLEELKRQREHDAQIKRKYGLKSLNELILRSEGKLVDYETRKLKGETIPDIIIQNEKRNRKDLEQKKEHLLKEIKGETHLSHSWPKVLGVAAVLSHIPTDDALKTDPQVEEVGMNVAMEYERKQGRAPEDISMQNLGFDIRSVSPDETVRYIEVKARSKEGKIALTPNEWLMANRLKDEYWLYVVIVNIEPTLYIIQNPAQNLKPNEEIEIVRYVIEDWKEKAKKVK